MNVENEWDQMVEAAMVEGPVEGVTDEEAMEAMNKTKLGKAAGPSEVNMDMIYLDISFLGHMDISSQALSESA